MFLLNHASDNGSRTAFNLDAARSLNVDCTSGVIYLGDRTIVENLGDNAAARFADIVLAYASDAKVYDVDEDIGAWKPKTRKPRTPAPEK